MMFYQEKNSNYFANARTDILPMLPKQADRVLEIGCGDGSTLLWAREQLNSSWTGGVELFEDAAEKAKSKVDWIAQGNIESINLPFEAGSIDLILCLDVLEHLWDPWTVVGHLSQLIKPGGVLVASIPNMLHHSVMLPLILRGRFDYRDEGVLDRTHIRFFTKATAVELFESGGLVVNKIINARMGSRSRLLNMMSCGFIKTVFEAQYLISAQKSF